MKVGIDKLFDPGHVAGDLPTQVRIVECRKAGDKSVDEPRSEDPVLFVDRALRLQAAGRLLARCRQAAQTGENLAVLVVEDIHVHITIAGVLQAVLHLETVARGNGKARQQQVDIYKEKTEPDEDTAAGAWSVQEQEKYKRRGANLAAATLRAFNLRREFVAGISNGQAKAHLHDILRLAGQVCFMAEDGSADLDKSLLAGLLEISVDLENDAFPMDAYKAEMDRCPEYTLLATLYASIDSDRMEYWGSRWDMENHRSVLVHEENRLLDFVYDTLETFGYQMSDEEAALQDGTHELFQEESAE